MSIWRAGLPDRFCSLSADTDVTSRESVKFFASDLIPRAALPRGAPLSAILDIELAEMTNVVSTVDARATTSPSKACQVSLSSQKQEGATSTSISSPQTPRKRHPTIVGGSMNERTKSFPVTPLSNRRRPCIAPCTPQSKQHGVRKEAGRVHSAVNINGLWTPPTSQTKTRTMVRGSQRLRHSIAKVATGEEIPVMTAFLRDVALSAF